MAETIGARIRVLHFLTVDTLAGTELSSYQIVRALDKQRFDIEVAFLVGGGPVSDLLFREGIKVHSVAGNGNLSERIGGLLRFVRSDRFDVVHLFGFKTGLLGRLIFALLSPTTVVIQGIRGQHLTQTIDVDSIAARLALRVERWLSPLIDFYVANSNGAASFLRRRGLPGEKVVWIPSGVDSRRWNMLRPNNRSVPLVASTARFHPVKRHRDIVEALDLIFQEGVAFRCVLAGDGLLFADVQAMTSERGLGKAISFPGELNRDEVRSLLAQAEVFVIASEWEGLPRSVMEAMAAGLPVVGTDVNGINELVVDGETGLLVPLGDTVALADALKMMLTDYKMRIKMGQSGRERIETEFSLRETTRRIEAFYERAVEAGD